MRIRPSHTAKLLALASTGALALGGCGSGGTMTVTAASSATAPGRPKTRSTALVTPKPVPKPTTTTTSASGQTGPTTTRTATAPAFTGQGAESKSGGSEGLSGALATVKAHGFTASDTSDYNSQQTLQVLIGTRTGSSDGHGQQAFFFVDGRYIGTDASEPSATVKVVSQNDTEVTLAYPLYRAHDPLCCPGGGQADVKFQLNNGHLMALDPIPPVSSGSGLSRQ